MTLAHIALRVRQHRCRGRNTLLTEAAEASCFEESMAANGYAYLRCQLRTQNKSCQGCGKSIAPQMEQVVFDETVQRG